MFNFNLNPCNISAKVAAMALVDNALNGVKNLPGHAANGIASLKANKAQKEMKAKMATISELNEVEKTIADMMARGITGDELDTAMAYADMLRAKL